GRFGRGRGGDGGRGPGTAGRGRRGLRDRRGRSGRGDGGEAGGARVPPCGGPGRRAGAPLRLPRRPRDDQDAFCGRRAAPRQAASDTKLTQTRDTSAGTVAEDERVRLFCALRLPEAVLDELVEWQQGLELPEGVRPVPRENAHITLAFLGWSPAGRVQGAVESLRRRAPRIAPPRFAVERYRE